MKKEVWYLPVEKPSVVGWKPPGTITGNAGRLEAWTVEVLGPPVPALPDALSPEARALLDAVAYWHKTGDGDTLFHAARSYAATLTPPDPLREAREALERARVAFGSGMRESVNAELGNVAHALDRLAEQGGAA